MQRQFGPEAVARYIVSFTSSAGDVIDVLDLAAEAGADELVLDVVPLFESSEALTEAGSIVEALLADARYRAHLRGRGDRQEVMLGLLGLDQGVRLRRRELAAPPGPGGSRRRGGPARHRADAVPRPRRRHRAGWGTARARGRGAAARVGRRQAEADRAGRGDLDPLRRPRDRAPAPRDADGGGDRFARRAGGRGRGPRGRARRDGLRWRRRPGAPIAPWSTTTPASRGSSAG